MTSLVLNNRPQISIAKGHNDLKAIILLEVFEMRCQSHRLLLEMILSTNQPHHLCLYNTVFLRL